MSTSSDLRERVLETLWSQWHELGVAAVTPRRHSDDCIDPEALIVFTATHGDLDPRLRDESIDWIVRYGSYVSRARLKNVASEWGVLEAPLFREYAATVNAHGGVGWPAASAKPIAFRPRARALLEDLTRDALLSLRLRAVFGVGARAELLRALLSHPTVALTASDLSAATAYGKRNVLNELEPLRFAGIVTSFRAGNADRYSLAKSQEVVALVGPLPRRFTSWAHAFGLLHAMLDLASRAHKRSALRNAVDAVRLLEDKRLLAAADVSRPSLPAGAAAWNGFLEWAAGYAKLIARE